MMNDSVKQELLQKMSEQRERLLDLLSTLGEEAAEFAPKDVEGEGQWSPKQQASHLTEMETAYRAWVEAALRQDSPDVTTVRGSAVAIPLEEAHEHTVGEHISSLRSERARTVTLVENMEAAALARKAQHKWFGSLTVLQWLRSYYRHDRMHMDQIAGREPDYKPQFTSDQEPDQRRQRLL